MIFWRLCSKWETKELAEKCPVVVATPQTAISGLRKSFTILAKGAKQSIVEKGNSANLI